jgi:transposase
LPPEKRLVAVSSAPPAIGQEPIREATGGKDMTFAAGNPTSPVEVVLGVDTHLDFHVAVGLDQLGRKLGALTVPTTRRGYESLLEWARRLGCVGRAGLEGTGSYGAGLARYLRTQGVEVLEVERPRRRSRHKGKSDPIDAEAAARAVLADEVAGAAKSGDGGVEVIRLLRAARRSAVKARTQAANQLRAFRSTAPEGLGCRLRGGSPPELSPPRRSVSVRVLTRRTRRRRRGSR